jgi:hypothetical protein
MKEFREWLDEGDRRHPLKQSNTNNKINEGETLDDCILSGDFLPYIYRHMNDIFTVNAGMGLENIESSFQVMDAFIAARLGGHGTFKIQLVIENTIRMRDALRFSKPRWTWEGTGSGLAAMPPASRKASAKDN